MPTGKPDTQPHFGMLTALSGLALIAASVTRQWHFGPLQPADVLLGLSAFFWCSEILLKKSSTPKPLFAPFSWVIAALAGVALLNAPQLSSAAVEVGKTFLVLVAGTLFFANLAYARAAAVRLTIAAATVALVVDAAVQYLIIKTDAVSVAGLLDSRTLYGACVAAGAPFLIAELTERSGGKNRLRGGLIAGVFVLLASLTLLSAPMLVLFAIAALATAALTKQLKGVAVALTLALVLIGGHLLPRDNAAALVDSVAAFDSNGHVRRIAIEAYAGAHAIADRPLLGHGPGNYQHTVSSAQYRGSLPPPAENRVEKGTNPGYAVIAVEFGIPAAALFAAMLLAAGIRALRRTNDEVPPDYAAAVSAFALAGASGFTVLLINGPGFLMAAVLGLCVAQQQKIRDASTPALNAASARFPRLPRRLFGEWAGAGMRLAGFVLAVALGLMLHATLKHNGASESYEDVAAADYSGKGRAVVVLEAEEAVAFLPPMHKAERRDASSGFSLKIDEGAGKPPVVEGSAVYGVDIAEHGRYRIWVRGWWNDGCSNSVAASFDGGPPYLMGNDGNYWQWHWVRGPALDLQPGRHELTLFEREDHLEIDEIALSNDDGFTPAGALESTTKKLNAPATPTSPATPASVVANTEPVKPPVVAPAEPVVPGRPQAPEPAPPPPTVDDPTLIARAPTVPTPVVAPSAPVVAATERPKPKDGPRVVVGVGGAYRDGFEGHLVSMGVPYVRLRDDQLGKIDDLKDIDVLMVSEAHCGSAAFMQTLYAFLKSGRTAVIEFLPEDFNNGDDPDDLFFRSQGKPFQGSTLLTDDSRFFKGVASAVSYPRDVTCNWIPATSNAPGVTLFGGQSRGGTRKTASALMIRTVGTGKLYYMGIAAGFSAMWRGRKIDPYLVNVIRDAVGPNCAYPYVDLDFAPRVNTIVNATDDFMRNPGEGGGWKVLEGKFGLTGPSQDQNTAFSVHAVGTSFAVIGAETWKDYRVMSAVLPGSGEAGIWQAIPGGRLTLRLRSGSAVVLTRRADNGDEKVLAEATVPDYPGAWRRLALFNRDGVTQGFVDGEPALAAKDAPVPSGRCGICTINGDAHFDDFAAIDTSALTPGRDVAPNEEGSERCLVRYRQRCSEKLSIYSPMWMMRPLPTDQSVMQAGLPLYMGGQLCIDDRAPVPIGAGADLALMKFDAFPHFDLALHTPGWRDYHFAGRVTDWYTTSGEWMQINRWSCNPEYEWYGGKSTQDTAVLWHKHAATGPVAIEALMAPRADRVYHEEQGRDLNVVIYGNGKNLNEGYLFTVLSEGHGCQLSKNGKVLATAPAMGLEASGHTLHHSWFSVAAVVSGKKIQFYFDRRLALEYEDAEPLSEGRVGIWTRQNKISVGRATVSFSH